MLDGTTAAHPTCQLLCNINFSAAFAAQLLPPLFHSELPCLLIDWLVVRSSDLLHQFPPINLLVGTFIFSVPTILLRLFTGPGWPWIATS